MINLKRNSKILLYSFYNPRTISNKIIFNSRTEDTDIYFLGNLNSLINKICKNKYDLIIGIGNYRKNAKHIRIETKFINRYGKRKINLTGPEFYSSNSTIQDGLNNNFIFSKTTTNGPCNRSGYKVMECIAKNAINSRFLFVHVPKSYDLKIATKEIKGII